MVLQHVRHIVHDVFDGRHRDAVDDRDGVRNEKLGLHIIPYTHKFVVPQIIRLQVVQHGIALVVYSNTIRQAPTEPGVQHHGATEQMSKVPRDDLRPSLHHHIDGSRHFLIGVGGNIPTKSGVEERGTFWTDTEGWRSTPRCSCR